MPTLTEWRQAREEAGRNGWLYDLSETELADYRRNHKYVWVQINPLEGKMTKRERELLSHFPSVDELVFWSFRYFLGRMTIATVVFAEKLARAWPSLSKLYADLIKSELEAAFRQDDKDRQDENHKWHTLGMDSDREAWEKVRKAYSKAS